MAKGVNQKQKILYLRQILLERTDEKHPISMAEILEALEAYGIQAERKSIYADIETLKNFGMDIIHRREQPSGYCVVSREFELPELKLLVDAVQSSKFLTARKSEQLIRKLESLTSRYEAKQLARQVGVTTSFIGHLERGSRKASLETLLALANALHVGVDYLLCDSLNTVRNDSGPDGLSRGQRYVMHEILSTLQSHLDDWNGPSAEG